MERTASGRLSALSSGPANQRWSVRAQTQPQHLGRKMLAVASFKRFAPPCNVLLPLWQRGQLSSSTLLQ